MARYRKLEPGLTDYVVADMAGYPSKLSNLNAAVKTHLMHVNPMVR